MTLAIVIVMCVVWYLGLCVAKEIYADAKDRRDDRIMAAWKRQEDARSHAENLAAIDRTAQATAEEMVRVAGEANGSVITGTSVDIRRRRQP